MHGLKGEDELKNNTYLRRERRRARKGARAVDTHNNHNERTFKDALLTAIFLPARLHIIFVEQIKGKAGLGSSE